MRLKLKGLAATAVFAATLSATFVPPAALAAVCKTQSQLTQTERDNLANFAHILVANVQKGDKNSLKAHTLPAIAADFSGIAEKSDEVQPLIQTATITVDSLFILDATAEAAGEQRTDFFCGSPVIVMNFNGLPPGMYAVAILHATGVAKPQLISLVLAQGPDKQWMLGGFQAHAMLESGHDGLWYWVAARKFADKKENWPAWFYYRTATDFLMPNNFLVSPNLEKLQKEQEAVKPANMPIPADQPLILNANGSSYSVTGIDTTSELGGFDLEVNYNPDANQVSQLRNPPAARKQVTDVMLALLGLHPELQSAFHGIWVHANQGTNSLFSLELPMDQIMPQSLTPPLATGTAKP